MHSVHVLRAVPQSIELKENAEKSMKKNEKYVGIKAEKVWRQDYYTL